MPSEQTTITRNRSRHEMVAEFLSSISGGDKTRSAIYYDLRTTWTQVNSYLELLVGNGFAVEIEKNKYRITPKGRAWLDQFRKLPPIIVREAQA